MSSTVTGTPHLHKVRVRVAVFDPKFWSEQQQNSVWDRQPMKGWILCVYVCVWMGGGMHPPVHVLKIFVVHAAQYAQIHTPTMSGRA